MALLGKLLHRLRADADRSPLADPSLAAPAALTVSSTAFTDGGAIPTVHAGKKVGDNTSPPLQWAGAPSGTQQFVLVLDDVDVPARSPLVHTIAVIEPDITGLEAGGLRPGAPGVRFVKAFGSEYVGPAPIPGHGPHHYRFHLLALDSRVPDAVADHKALFAAIAGHVIARGVITGTYER